MLAAAEEQVRYVLQNFRAASSILSALLAMLSEMALAVTVAKDCSPSVGQRST
ncbi:MAG: hypothetical protein JXB46_10520 [Candidatus Eisenbacteria bacterium]|nr:hypothetical protein [Candidatus Eisenbacteria bacterium]